MSRWREAVLVLQGWWTWGAVTAAIIWGLVAYEAVMRPHRVELVPDRAMALYPVAVDTAGACRVVFWQQQVRLVP